MSYDITLNDPVTGDTLLLDAPHNMRGGTFCVGGTARAWLNVTYNYAPHFLRALGPEGIRTLYGMTGPRAILRRRPGSAGGRAGRRPVATLATLRLLPPSFRACPRCDTCDPATFRTDRPEVSQVSRKSQARQVRCLRARLPVAGPCWR